jgi:hypothetical protein
VIIAKLVIKSTKIARFNPGHFIFVALLLMPSEMTLPAKNTSPRASKKPGTVLVEEEVANTAVNTVPAKAIIATVIDGCIFLDLEVLLEVFGLISDAFSPRISPVNDRFNRKLPLGLHQSR